MKKILLISTGGTIASTAGDEGLSPTLCGDSLLSFVQGAENAAQIETINILNVDSSNMQPEDWLLIAQTIYENYCKYDGIIVLHGTDTMAYSASAVSFMTIGLNIPVIFTGAQIPIVFPESDGRRNLKDAIDVVCKSGLIGVYVVFNGRVIAGCCASKVDTEAFDAFQSINGKEIARIEDGNITIFSLPPKPSKDHQWKISIDKRVLLWKLTPGLSPELLDQSIQNNYKIIVIEAFGIGGIPMLKNSFLPKILEWRTEGILTVVTTQCYHGKCDMSIYETGRLALNKGAICAGNMTREALFTKLMWLLSITDDLDQIIVWLKKNFCGEFGEYPGPHKASRLQISTTASAGSH